jgi:rhodanese-related sulfurtransferase
MLIAQSINYNKMLDSLLKKTVAPIKVSEAVLKKGVYFFDTRLKKEYDISHIKNAQWIGYEEFSLKKLKNIPKESEIILYCSVGARSEQIGEKLQKAGYKNVKNLWGGLFQWVNEGHSVVDNQVKITQKVHAYSPEWGVWLQKGQKVYN